MKLTATVEMPEGRVEVSGDGVQDLVNFTFTPIRDVHVKLAHRLLKAIEEALVGLGNTR